MRKTYIATISETTELRLGFSRTEGAVVNVVSFKPESTDLFLNLVAKNLFDSDGDVVRSWQLIFCDRIFG